MKPRSLRRDLAIGLSVGLTLVWILAMAVGGRIMREEMDEVFDSALQETAERILPLAVIDDLNSGGPIEARRVTRVGSHREYLSYVVRGPTGAIMLYSHDAELETFAGTPQVGFRTTDTHRIYASTAASGAYMIEVAEPLENRREAIVETLQALLLPLLLLLPFSLLFVAWLTRRSLRPVKALSAEVQGRDASDLSPLSTRGLQTELLPTRDAVNRLMARLRRTLEAERSFTANAAHELRTPVAASLAHTQRLIAEAPEGPLRDRARTIEAEMHRLGRLSEKLLQLSRAEGGGVLSETPQDLVPILAVVAQEFERADQPSRLRLTLPDEALSWLDAEAFAILARNLIENALTHGDPVAPVAVTLTTDGALRVTNAGPVVPQQTLARLTTRFERAGSRAKGSGLGLAIAASIAAGAGMKLTLASPAPGQPDGFEARLIP